MNQEDILKAVEDKFTESKNSIEAVKGEQLQEIQKLKDENLELKNEFSLFKAKFDAGLTNQDKSKKSDVRKAIEENLANLRNVGTNGRATFEIKATPGTITPFDKTHVDGNLIAGVQLSPTPISPVERKLNLLEVLPTYPATAPLFTWVEVVNKEGDAEFLECGDVKPSADFDLLQKQSSAKKVAITMTICTEWLDDLDYLSAYVENYLREKLYDKITEQILIGDGLGANLLGILPQGSAFNNALYSQTVKFANEIDAISAVVASLTCFGCTADMIMLNCDDWFKITHQKDANGQYLQIPGLDIVNKRIGSLRVIEVPNAILPPDTFVLLDTSKIQIAVWRGIMTTWGYNQDDFIRNRMTCIVEARLLSFMSQTTCLTVDTFANVVTFIDKP